MAKQTDVIKDFVDGCASARVGKLMNTGNDLMWGTWEEDAETVASWWDENEVLVNADHKLCQKVVDMARNNGLAVRFFHGEE